MKTITSAISIALVSTAALILPADAADIAGNGNGGIKDYGHGGVPVPAPIPYQDSYKWFMGAGVGWVGRSNGDVNATGIGGAALSTEKFSDANGPAVFSATMGRYITPSFRVELGVDVRTPIKVARGTTNYVGVKHDVGPNVTLNNAAGDVIYNGPSHNYNTYDVMHNETTKYQNHTFLVSGIYQFNREGRFKPYVGAGAGLTLHMIKRQSTDDAECTQGGNDAYDLYGVPFPATCNNTANLPSSFSSRTSRSSSAWGLAAALMAGVTYDLSSRTHLDFGYRALFQTRNVVDSNDTSSIRVGVKTQHELRTGVRFDLW